MTSVYVGAMGAVATTEKMRITLHVSRPVLTWSVGGAVLVMTLMALIRLVWVGQSTWFEKETRKKVRQIERQLDTLGVEPSGTTLDALRRDQERLRHVYADLVSVVDPERAWDSRLQQDPGLYFREQLHGMEKELGRQAFHRSLTLPEEMGFPADMPSRERVPVLLHSIELLNTVGQALLAEDVRVVELLRMRDPVVVAQNENGEPLFHAVPAQVRFQAPTHAVYAFLASVVGRVPVVELTALRIRSESPNNPVVQADVVLTSYVVVDRDGATTPGGGS